MIDHFWALLIGIVIGLAVAATHKTIRLCFGFDGPEVRGLTKLEWLRVWWHYWWW